jgi:hypothetical protein
MIPAEKLQAIGHSCNVATYIYHHSKELRAYVATGYRDVSENDAFSRGLFMTGGGHVYPPS